MKTTIEEEDESLDKHYWWHEYSLGCLGCIAERDERERIIKLIKNRICFGHLETGNCEHSVCHGNTKLIDLIEREVND